MKYCLTGLQGLLVRRERSCGININSMTKHVIKFGEISKIQCNFKFKCLTGYYTLLSVTQNFACEGLVILNNVVTQFNDKPLVICVTSASKNDIIISPFDYFANMMVLEEGDRSSLRLNTREWAQYMKINNPQNLPKEVVNISVYNVSDNESFNEDETIAVEEDEDIALANPEIQELDSDKEKPSKIRKKNSVTYSDDNQSEDNL